MITPHDIRVKSEHQYLKFLACWVQGMVFFPYKIPIGKRPDDFKKLRDSLDLLLHSSKRERGFGYDVIVEKRQTRRYGLQSIPTHIVFEDEDNFLQFMRKQQEFIRFKEDVNFILRDFPQLTNWIAKNTQKVIDYNGYWFDIMSICQYFLDNPRPNLYLREIPVKVHTKFIEMHQEVIRKLLDTLLPDEYINSSTTVFEKRFGLKYDEPSIRFRILDESINKFQFMDFSIPLSQAMTLDLQNHTIIIAENKINFLTIPRVPKSIALFGKGFNIEVLKHCAWLKSCNIVYWGDMDSHGFQILSMLRSYFPHSKSIMMDQETFDAFKEFVVQGHQLALQSLLHLTPAEQVMFDYINTHQFRLEQEHLSHDYVTQTFSVYFGGID